MSITSLPTNYGVCGYCAVKIFSAVTIFSWLYVAPEYEPTQGYLSRAITLLLLLVCIYTVLDLHMKAMHVYNEKLRGEEGNQGIMYMYLYRYLDTSSITGLGTCISIQRMQAQNDDTFLSVYKLHPKRIWLSKVRPTCIFQKIQYMLCSMHTFVQRQRNVLKHSSPGRVSLISPTRTCIATNLVHSFLCHATHVYHHTGWRVCTDMGSLQGLH